MPTVRSFGAPPPAARETRLSDGAAWQVPEETPVAFVYNSRNYAVMLATPLDLADFAVGFSLTERVVDAAEEIDAIDIHASERGVEFHLSIDAARLERFDVRQQRRNIVGRTGCGVCGLENAETFFEALPRVGEQKQRVGADALMRALKELPWRQPLNERTRTVHAAAWAGLDGAVRLVREDVGRHNALDKLLGALALAGADMSEGFVMMSSRCSYEIIEKAARRGVRAVAAISAPTAFAIRKAEEANVGLYARAGAGFVEIA
ncbi:MAG: formate dehydrogenase accessory sulfurtransferase FdhD [Amphiplicatus sp.]